MRDTTTDPTGGFGPRWGVYHRTTRRGKFALIAHAGTEAAARNLMFVLMGTYAGGDWHVTRVAPAPVTRPATAPRG